MLNLLRVIGLVWLMTTRPYGWDTRMINLLWIFIIVRLLMEYLWWFKKVANFSIPNANTRVLDIEIYKNND